jgi:putative transposase
MAAVTELASEVGTSAACQALCMPRPSYYRDRRKTSFPAETASRPTPPRALRPVERETVLSRLHEERFQDRSPAAVYAAREARGDLQTSRSVDTSALQETRTARHGTQSALELGHHQAARTHEVDLLLPLRDPGCFQPLRHRWMVAMRESAELAKRLIAESCQKQGIQPGQLTLHAGRGTSMSSKPVAFLLADLGVTKTHSRPHVSNDNLTPKANSLR